MTYITDITSLSPDHLWTLDGIYTDEVGSVTGTNAGGIITESGLCTDTSNCWSSDTIAGDRITLPTTTDIENGTHTIKAVGGWFQASKSQPHPCRIYGEGDAQPTYQIVLAMANNTMFEVVDGVGDIAQVYGISFVADRSYHVMTTFDNGEIELIIDGISMGTANLSSSTLSARTEVATFADPSGTVGVGGDTVLLQAPVNGRYNYWGTWEGTKPTVSEIRTSFEQGALPDVTITNQAGLDALADTLRPNVPCCIRITGDGTIDLTADNITFDELASIHIQYTGTGTLNWTNINGSNATIVSNLGGGTVNLLNPYTLEFTNIQDDTEIRVYEHGTTNEVTGVELSSGGTWSDTISVSAVDVRIVSIYYKIIYYNNILINSNNSIALEQSFDRNYNGDFIQSLNLITSDTDENKIYIHSGISNTVSSSFPSPSNNCDGLTSDGTNLISIDSGTDLIYIHSGITSTISSSFSTPATYSHGIAFDGVNLISSDYTQEKIYIHSGITDSVSSSFSVSPVNPEGLAFDGTNVITADGGDNLIYVHSGVTSTVDDSFSTPTSSFRSMTFDGTNLITGSYSPAKIYIHSGVTSTISSSFSAPSTRNGGMTYM